MIVHKEDLDGTTASGSLTKTTARFPGGLLKQLFVNPATATTTYNVLLEDANADEVFQESNIEGKLSVDLDTPVNGILSLKITSASADEAFTNFLRLLEADR